MLSRAFTFFVLSLSISSTLGAPVPRQSKRATFAVQDYASFQISDGTAGDSKARADAVFVTPFAGRDLATVTADELKAVKTMREAAEDAETGGFNPAIASAGKSTDAGKALQAGKIANKVLKLTGEVQALQIQAAQDKAAGKDTSATETKIAAEQKKLTNNINTDTASKGQAMTPVSGASASSSGSASNSTTTDTGSSSSANSTSTDTSSSASNSTSTDLGSDSNSTSTAIETASTGSTFAVLDYAKFQISDGTAGDAKSRADAVFVTPFAGRDLATVSADELKAVQTMREAAEDAEVSKFNPAIDSAGKSTDAGKALQAGKIANKVLKLTGEVQALQIKLAQQKAAGKDTSSTETSIAAEQKKLTTNINLDTTAKGQKMTSVA